MVAGLNMPLQCSSDGNIVLVCCGVAMFRIVMCLVLTPSDAQTKQTSPIFRATRYEPAFGMLYPKVALHGSLHVSPKGRSYSLRMRFSRVKASAAKTAADEILKKTVREVDDVAKWLVVHQLI